MTPHPSGIHIVLARSYLAYFIFSMLGLFLDSYIALDVESSIATLTALICFGAGPLLIGWAQYTSRHCTKSEHKNDPYFHHGPYRYLRNPTHLGLLILITGYTLVSGSIIFFTISVIGYFVSNIFFKKYESLLIRTYGEHYTNYKSSVRKIL